MKPTGYGGALLGFVAILWSFLPHPLTGSTAKIDAATTHQVIRGFGGATAFLPTTPIAAGDLDTLFGNGPGQIGFTWLRIRLASDDAWREVELANARGARARGASVIATPWSPPPSMKSNHDIVGGFLLPSSYADYAKYLNDFARYMSDNGAPLYALSVQNEPDIAVTYESCGWTPAQMLEFCRNYVGTVTATKVIAPESFQFRKALSDPLLTDGQASANIDIIGGHIYGAGLEPYPLAATKGKEVWMTEHLDLSTDWAGALATGKEIHDCLATANFNAYFWWYLRRYYGPLAEDSTVSKRGWVMAHFAKFVRPGFVRIEATATPTAGVYVSAYKRDRLVIVAINQNAAAIAQSFAVGNATMASVTPWTTSEQMNFQSQPTIAMSSGSFSATLPASSITTFVADLVFPAPAITRPPQSHTIASGGTVTFDVEASAELPAYQWKHDGLALAGATSRILTIANAQPADAGGYTVSVTNSGGTVSSSAATLTVSATAAPGRLVNLSTRAIAGAGDAVQIAGFVVGGTSARAVLVRAAGPTLQSSFGVTGVLADPMLELRDQATGAIVATNDDWESSLAATFRAVSAFPWPVGSKDAALVATVNPGAYSAIVRGKNGATGIALVEIYGVETDAASPLINLSTRSLAATGDAVQIAGFAILGDAAKTVVLRSAGPTLRKAFQLTGALTDPTIELRRQGDATVLAASDNWNVELASHFASVGAFAWPEDSKDAAVVATLDPGEYSVVVRGVGDSTGIALVEVYAEP